MHAHAYVLPWALLPARGPEFAAQYPESATLLAVQVVHRHGPRTPGRWSLPEVYPPFWPLCGRANAGRADIRTRDQEAALRLDASDASGWIAHAGEERHRCPLGALTDLGEDAMEDLGRVLRAQYIDSGLIDAAEAVCRSTAYERTIASVRALVRGLFPGKKEATQHVAVRDQKNETMNLFAPCPALDRIGAAALAAFAPEHARILNSIPWLRDLQSADRKLSASDVFDTVWSARTHGLPLPDGTTDAHVSSLGRAYLAHIGSALQGEPHTGSRLYCGRFWPELVADADAAIGTASTNGPADALAQRIEEDAVMARLGYAVLSEGGQRPMDPEESDRYRFLAQLSRAISTPMSSGSSDYCVGGVNASFRNGKESKRPRAHTPAAQSPRSSSSSDEHSVRKIGGDMYDDIVAGARRRSSSSSGDDYLHLLSFSSDDDADLFGDVDHGLDGPQLDVEESVVHSSKKMHDEMAVEVGSGLDEIARQYRDAQEICGGDSSADHTTHTSKANKRLQIYSAHDSTLVCMLAALGLVADHAPAYASALVFEHLWVPGRGRHVRVLYNNRVLRVPACADEEAVPGFPRGDLCKWATLTALLRLHTPGDFDAECGNTAWESGPGLTWV